MGQQRRKVLLPLQSWKEDNDGQPHQARQGSAQGNLSTLRNVILVAIIFIIDHSLLIFSFVVRALSMWARLPSAIIAKLVATLTLHRIAPFNPLHCGSTVRTFPEPCLSYRLVVDHLVPKIAILFSVLFFLANYAKFLTAECALDVLKVIWGYFKNAGALCSGTKVKLYVGTYGHVD